VVGEEVRIERDAERASSLPAKTFSMPALAMVPSGFQIESLPARSRMNTRSSTVTSMDVMLLTEMGSFTRWYEVSGGMSADRPARRPASALRSVGRAR